jgi:hypothetical protein
MPPPRFSRYLAIGPRRAAGAPARCWWAATGRRRWRSWRGFDVLGALEGQAEILHEALDGPLQIRHRDGDMVQSGDHVLHSQQLIAAGTPQLPARGAAAISSGDSILAFSSGTTLNSGCPFLMITPSPLTSTFSTVPAERRVDLVEHLHHFDDVERIALFEVGALADKLRRTGRLAGIEHAAAAARISSPLASGGGTSTLRHAAWCSGSSIRSGMWMLRSGLTFRSRIRCARRNEGQHRQQFDAGLVAGVRGAPRPTASCEAGSARLSCARKACTSPFTAVAGETSLEFRVKSAPHSAVVIVIPDHKRGGTRLDNPCCR